MKRISFLLAALLMMGGMVMAQGPRRGGQDMDQMCIRDRLYIVRVYINWMTV